MRTALVRTSSITHGWSRHTGGQHTRTDHPGVVTVFECASVAEAERICQGFPLVCEGLIDFEFIPVSYFKP